MTRLARHLPILDSGRQYRRSTLTNDLIAAIIVTIMLIPQSLAYAMLAGLPAEPGIGYALVGCHPTDSRDSIFKALSAFRITATSINSCQKRALNRREIAERGGDHSGTDSPISTAMPSDRRAISIPVDAVDGPADPFPRRILPATSCSPWS